MLRRVVAAFVVTCPRSVQISNSFESQHDRDSARRRRWGTGAERKRKTTWKEFLTQHREVIVAAGFYTVEAWTREGLTRFLGSS